MSDLDQKALEAVRAAPFRKYTIGETIDDTAIETIITAYLSALPAQPAGTVHDPIVWELEAAQRSHYEHFEGDSSGLVDDGERAKANKRLWAAIEATLDALSALPAQPVAVKPIQWEQPDGPGGSSWLGHGLELCQFYIRLDDGEWIMPGDAYGEEANFEAFATIEGAKAAAQASYDALIRSALAAPSQQEGVTEAIDLVREIAKIDPVFAKGVWKDRIARAREVAALVDRGRVKP